MDEDTLTIKEAADVTGLNAHTLRYYEQAGLLEPVHRNTGGHRRYSRVDVERLRFLACLRATGMPIRRLREYAALTRQGRSSLSARLELLDSHKRDVQEKIAELERSLEVIEGKMKHYSRARGD